MKTYSRRRLLIVLVVFYGLSCLNPSQGSQSNPKEHMERGNIEQIELADGVSQEWKRATFKDLVMGVSTISEMKNVLGEPLSATRVNGTKIDKTSWLWFSYEVDSPIPGKVEMIVDEADSVIDQAVLSPRNLSRDGAIEFFGKDFLITRYSFDECLGEGGEAPLYESSSGKLEFIEYRSKGIAISVGFNDLVTEIDFLSKPLGTKNRQC